MKKKNILLVCHVGLNTGLGHLSRLLALAQSLRATNKFNIEFLIFGDDNKNKELEFFRTQRVSSNSNFEISIKKIVKKQTPFIIVFDLDPKLLSVNLEKLFTWIKKNEIKLIGIDSLINYISFFDLIWMPTFSYNFKNTNNFKNKLIFGWDTLLIQKRLQIKKWKTGKRVLVLTGGSDITNLRESLPNVIDCILSDDTIIDWVQGPFSEFPNIPTKPRLTWNIHKAPIQLDKMIVESNYVLTVYGISFFEVLQYGIPTVVFSPYGDKDKSELNSLSKEGVAIVADNYELAVKKLVEFMHKEVLAKEYSKNALRKMSINGAQNLSNKICSLTETI